MPTVSRRQLACAAGVLAASLLACNAILGVEDVTLRDEKGSSSSSGSSSGDDPDPDPDPDPDAGRPAAPRAALALGQRHGCARLVSGSVRCWGVNDDGQLGLGVAFDAGAFARESLEPRDVPGLDGVVAVAAGLHHSCAVHEDGAASCWGWNPYGALGDGTKVSSVKPVQVVGVTDAVAIACGNVSTCIVRRNKTVGCWGANSGGQLGDGTKTDRLEMVAVPGLTGVVGIAAGYLHACALRETGEVSCWGANRSGQLGSGGTVDSLEPVKVTGIADAVQIAAAASFACARLASGRVSCWGENFRGQLGRGSTGPGPNATPEPALSLDDAVHVWAGFDHACAVRRGGEVVCWGDAGDGQVGTGQPVLSDASAPTPTTVAGVARAFAVATGGARSCALTEDDRALCWGANDRGQLGNGTKDVAYGAVPMKNFP